MCIRLRDYSEEIGDAFEQLDARRPVADPMAAAGKNHQAVRIVSV